MSTNLLLYRLTFSNMESGKSSFMYVRSECDNVAKAEAYIRMIGGKRYHVCHLHYCKVVEKRVVPVRYIGAVFNKSYLPY